MPITILDLAKHLRETAGSRPCSYEERREWRVADYDEVLTVHALARFDDHVVEQGRAISIGELASYAGDPSELLENQSVLLRLSLLKAIGERVQEPDDVGLFEEERKILVRTKVDIRNGRAVPPEQAAALVATIERLRKR